MIDQLVKYPRTRHVEGSRVQAGDEDLELVPFAELRGRHLVVEEKVDGANAGVSFDLDGRLRLQSRGHFLAGGARERQFDRLKRWARGLGEPLREVLGTDHVAYGEWLWAKHTNFYDRLPDYFLEFDVLDRRSGEFLSTARRRALFQGLPVCAVPVLHEGPLGSFDELAALVGPSRFRSVDNLERLRAAARRRGLDPDRAVRESDPTLLMEGLYIKVEEEGCVALRCKLVRQGFASVVQESERHWAARPLLPNELAPEAGP